MSRRSARPRLGQHFLHDEATLEKIASALPLVEGSRVIEIGPGEGALTAKLLERGARVTAIELDRALFAGLQKRFEPTGRFELVESDVLEVDLAELIGEGPAFVIGNLPYYVTSPIIRRVFSNSFWLTSMFRVLPVARRNRGISSTHPSPIPVL